jgi:hypothetical protein
MCYDMTQTRDGVQVFNDNGDLCVALRGDSALTILATWQNLRTSGRGDEFAHGVVLALNHVTLTGAIPEVQL